MKKPLRYLIWERFNIMSELDAESIATLVKGGVATLSVALGSKSAALLIEKISGALGWYTEPRRIIRNAKAEAAASIIKAEAEQEAKSVSERTAQRILNEEERYQKNMESIALGAIASVTEDAKPNDIGDDWLDGFFNRARHISDELHQIKYGHIFYLVKLMNLGHFLFGPLIFWQL
jgi:hypothetical protein